MAEYNNAIFPAQIVAYILSALLILSLFKSNKYSHKGNALFISALWIWNGVVLQIVFFSQYHPQYYFWGALFVIQGLLFGWNALKGKLTFTFRGNIHSWLGLIFIAYGLIIYPMIGSLAGHPYPLGPIFGVAACPTVIFTFGCLMLTGGKIPLYLLYFPLFWAVISLYAILKMGILADIGETIIAIVSVFMIIRSRNYTPARAPKTQVALNTEVDYHRF